MRKQDGSFPLENNYATSDYNKYTDDLLTVFLQKILFMGLQVFEI